MRLPNPPLLLVTDRRQAARPLPELVELACAAGCRWISAREKDLSEADQIALVAALRPVADRHGAVLTLHGTAELAQAAGADGVHLPAGGNAAQARSRLGPGALLGISIHHAGEAINPAVNYAIAGPVYPTASKPDYGPALGAKGLALIARSAPVPVIAIGGIFADQVAEIRVAGAAGIAVMGGAMRAAHPEREIAGLLAAWAAQPRPR